MANVKTQLASIAKALADLSKRVEKVSKQIDTAKAKPAAKSGKPVAKKKTTAKAVAAKMTVLDRVYDVIRRSRNGATIAKLREKTKLEARQLSNALYKLSKKGKIKSKSRGVYVKS